MCAALAPGPCGAAATLPAVDAGATGAPGAMDASGAASSTPVLPVADPLDIEAEERARAKGLMSAGIIDGATDALVGFVARAVMLATSSTLTFGEVPPPC